ncbi:TPA: protein kinase [Bacillus thuringiensis]|uniref:protein kinase n=1 Tax=Bacillus thuringiensis TaxID=1428 RepID=UPI000BFC45CB|nr:protein kinase [Bacillus thuringiensis]PGS64623.1 serine/threonine protein kinase [Bacillus thuringiensis]HDX9688662.1 protein kinase [Bacillus thuringiensis]
MEQNEFKKLLKYFDEFLWAWKTSDTNWNYNGLILDIYFENSILSVEYLDIEDYFSTDYGFEYNETTLLLDQFYEVSEEKRLKVIEKVLNILKHTKQDQDVSINKLNKVIRFLERSHIKISNPPYGDLTLYENDKVDEGSYCVIKKVDNKSILKKELHPRYSNDEELQKRMKYEYENMQKLCECPQVLNVYSFDPENFSYLMERAEMNLFEYLKNEVDIPFDVKLKIIIDVLNGMKFAHEQSIIHRDLHLGNVLKIGNDFVISDFGLSKDESIERSLKSSPTEKNNHVFVDPLAIRDFTKLDRKSDIYSLGKLIDYVFTCGDSETQHLFTFIVEKCTSRDKDKRYNSVDEILKDVDFKLNERSNKFSKEQVLEKIQNNIIDIQVSEYIKELVTADKICDYIVKNQLKLFGIIILKFDQMDQIEILKAIQYNYVKSTGYGHFENYDIFGNIAYRICDETKEGKIHKLARSILEGCAQHRWSMEALIKKLDKAAL